jgi:hypothetical protein
VGTVCPAALLGSLINLDMLDDEVAGIEALGISIGLSILEKADKELSRLHGPASAGDTPLLAYIPNPSVLSFQLEQPPSHLMMPLVYVESYPHHPFHALLTTSSKSSKALHGIATFRLVP